MKENQTNYGNFAEPRKRIAVRGNDVLIAAIDKCERLQKQLKEANEIIKTINRVSGNIDLSQLVYEDRRKIDGITMQTDSYLEKWGVK